MDSINHHGLFSAIYDAENDQSDGSRVTKEAMVSLIYALSKALGLKDKYTSHHQNNVAILALMIAERMKLSPDHTLGLYIGAIVHDIGI